MAAAHLVRGVRAVLIDLVDEDSAHNRDQKKCVLPDTFEHLGKYTYLRGAWPSQPATGRCLNSPSI